MTSLVDGMQPQILVNFGYGGRTMILADKIIEERKKNGWTQEDLAQKLGVSRQSVSKWESAGAIPDLKKIIQLAYLFGVSTDYLLKDEIEKEKIDTSCDTDCELHRVMNIPWWRSHPIHENRATKSIWTEPCNPLLRATKSTKRATSA